MSMVVLWEPLSRITRDWCPRPCHPESLVKLKHSHILPTQGLKKTQDNLAIRLATSDPSRAWAQVIPIHQASRSRIGPRIWCNHQNKLKRPAKSLNRCLSSRMTKTTSPRQIQNSFQSNNWRKRSKWIIRSLPLKILQTRKLAATWMP